MAMYDKNPNSVTLSRFFDTNLIIPKNMLVGLSQGLIFGFIDIAKSRMESVEEVRVRIKDSLEHIDEHRLIAAPDCGLGFFTREQAIEKMSILTKAAKSI